MKKYALLKVIFSRRMLTSFIMGYACGLPYDMTKTVIKAWMSDEGIDLAVIGLFTLVGLPYALKFLWAPLLDRYTFSALGRRRGWLLLFQVALVLAVLGMSFGEPAASPWMLAFAAFLVTFFSASQDIVVDAYRREDLADAELGLGSSFYFYGYRIGMLVAGSGGLILADQLSFKVVYWILAACLLPGIVTTLLTPEPPMIHGRPRNFKETIVEPFLDYFNRRGALWMLGFILMYKLGDNIAAAILTPFYLDIGFTKTQIGAVVKLFGFWAISAGGLVGGIMMLKVGIRHQPLFVDFRCPAGAFNGRIRDSCENGRLPAGSCRRSGFRKFQRRNGNSGLSGLHGKHHQPEVHGHAVRSADQPDARSRCRHFLAVRGAGKGDGMVSLFRVLRPDRHSGHAHAAQIRALDPAQSRAGVPRRDLMLQRLRLNAIYWKLRGRQEIRLV